MKAKFDGHYQAEVLDFRINGLVLITHDDGSTEIGVDIDGVVASGDEFSTRTTEYIAFLTNFIVAVREGRKARSN